MKNYDEITNDLLERRERYRVEQKRKRKMIIGGTASLCCLVALLGFGIWHHHTRKQTPSAVGGQTKDVYILNSPTENTVEHNTSNAGGDTTIWLSADEVRKSAEYDTQYMGVSVPMLIAYQGAIYVCSGEECVENSQYARSEAKVTLRKNYAYPTYQIKDISDHVAIVLNGRLEIYKKLFEIKAVIDGNAYRIVQPMMSGIDYSCGEMIQENEDFSVYQATDPQSGEMIEAEYIINILPLLKRELPNFFDGNENYGDAWWLAIPQS